jgi:hypothetical protein
VFMPAQYAWAEPVVIASYVRNWVTESERGDVSWRLSRPAINSRKERYAYVEHYNHPATPARYNR